MRVIDFAGGIVQDHDQVIPALVLEPLMMAPVDVQQHSRQGPALPPFTVHPAFAGPCHQPGSLQRCFHPRIAQINLVFALQLLVKVTYVQIEVLVSIQPQNRLHRRQWNSFLRRLVSPSPAIALPVSSSSAPWRPLSKRPCPAWSLTLTARKSGHLTC